MHDPSPAPMVDHHISFNVFKPSSGSRSNFKADKNVTSNDFECIFDPTNSFKTIINDKIAKPNKKTKKLYIDKDRTLSMRDK